MKWTLQHFAHDRAAIAQVRTQMLAVRVHHGELTRISAPGDHLPHREGEREAHPRAQPGGLRGNMEDEGGRR